MRQPKDFLCSGAVCYRFCGKLPHHVNCSSKNINESNTVTSVCGPQSSPKRSWRKSPACFCLARKKKKQAHPRDPAMALRSRGIKQRQAHLGRFLADQERPLHAQKPAACLASSQPCPCSGPGDDVWRGRDSERWGCGQQPEG